MKLGIVQTVFSLQPNITSLFGPHLSSDALIVPPTTPDFPAQLQQRWTDVNAPSYDLGAIKPATEDDVQSIVKIASDNSLPFFVIGGGHGISNYSTFGGLAIDMGGFKSVSFSDDKSRLTIGGSVKIFQLIKPLFDAGRELPLGSCECVGVVGATLGGGIGGLQGERGLLLDALESVNIVTSKGKLVEASASNNKELFWALRGAGSNFGIVTSATYKLPKISNDGMYMNADFLFPAAANRSFFEILKATEKEMSSKLAINAVAAYNRQVGAPMLAVNAIYYGPMSEGRKLVESFEKMQPMMSNVTMVPAWDIIDAAFFRSFGQDNGACTPNQHINIYSVVLRQIHTPTFESFFGQLVRFWDDHPSFQGRWLMQRYATDGPLATADEASAYGHRHAKMYMNFEGFYEDRSLDDDVNEFWTSAREAFTKTGGYGRLSVYPNYARGDEGAEAWYGESLPRLQEVKQKYDPEGLFSVHNPIPLRQPHRDLV
ncbi:hypothetical protein M409DRAFT_62371 [Zasmidium cellare ATCC 36951]|uniref:FAD-binding PCMH-type domain-containing protein n=1 Tax=Zasmidium cellare ATCC 36951 TaxID=1080233 RepID=A0A6A6CZD4_ZASCE|nr:uncharacterized protein M409DRAFT_62371 [Zasmidium cellare ATCC 36951]KAF2172597.1 hypothetical protein M409DRAFT_62371 [Zasmidium cellare ATCC 36951]